MCRGLLGIRESESQHTQLWGDSTVPARTGGEEAGDEGDGKGPEPQKTRKGRPYAC